LPSFSAQVGWSYEKYMNFEKGKRVNMCDGDLKTICGALGLIVTVSVVVN
jgi:hypothetical protein